MKYTLPNKNNVIAIYKLVLKMISYLPTIYDVVAMLKVEDYDKTLNIAYYDEIGPNIQVIYKFITAYGWMIYDQNNITPISLVLLLYIKIKLQYKKYEARYSLNARFMIQQEQKLLYWRLKW